jgi:hypothetical protein
MAITINGNGTLTGVSVGGLPDGIVDTDMLATNAVATAKIADAAVTAAKRGAGAILQVVQTVKTDSFSSNTGSSFVDITGMSVSITPSSSSSKILLIPSLNLAAATSHRHGWQIKRDSTTIHFADSASNRRCVTSGQGNPPNSVMNYHYCTPFLDSPSTTSAITYKLQVIGEGSNTNIYVNRTEHDGDGSDKFRFASSMLAMEVAA